MAEVVAVASMINYPQHPYRRMLLALIGGLVAGLALAVVISFIPWAWLQYTILLGVVAGAIGWALWELRWVRAMQRKLSAEGEKLAAVLEEAERREAER